MSSIPLISNPDCNPECRACHYKELDYPEQLARKQKWADTQLARWADRLAPIEPAPESERLGYRFKSWLWSSTDQSFGLSFGLSFGMIRSRRAGTRWEKEFVSWNTCPLHAEPLREMMTRLRDVLVEGAPEFTKTALAGAWFGSPHLVIVARQDFKDALDLMRRMDWSKVLVAPFDRVWFHVNAQIGAKVFGHRPLVQLAGPPLESSHPVRAFRQVAHSLLKQARGLALSHLMGASPAQVLDLYCGTGELSLGLPAEVEWIGIEHSKEAIEFAMSLQKPGRQVHRAFVGAVEQRLADPSVLRLICSPYALYLNPPRCGLTPEARDQVIKLLKTQRAVSIAYLSCSASSLSRDLRFLEESGYRVESLRPFDFFPQTEHFETLATLTPVVDD